MAQLYRAVLSATALLVLLSLTVPAPVTGQETDDYLKSLLTEYYTGKIVRAKVAIPGDRKGLEIVDGLIRNTAVSGRTAAEPGDPLLIAQIRFRSRRIEVEFDGKSGDTSSWPGKGFTGRSARNSPPRILLQFTREITTRDLNIRTINNLLASAVDVSSLIPKNPRQPADPASGDESRKRPDAAQATLMLAERRARAEGIPIAEVTVEGTVTEPGIGEVTIECPAAQARLYIDDAFSGHTPRTIRLRAGVHKILVLCERQASWEKQFFIPAGSSSVIRAEVRPPGSPE
ncbi:MAG TPA: hypothetical protein VNQ79_22405 [Blastocatellia bacterium]|nr:hypothetical protein [Blastocatellia bacterium]